MTTLSLTEQHMPIDYAEEGRKLLAKVNLTQEKKGQVATRYSNADVIYQHNETSANLYVGNYRAAESMYILNKLQNCRRIVFCQDCDGERHFESNPEFQYLTFPIGWWQSYVPIGSSMSAQVLAFFFNHSLIS